MARQEALTVVERVRAVIEFRVLGPFEVLVEGRALELKRRKQRSLLALLLLHAGEVVSTDRLVEELWAGNPRRPRSARSEPRLRSAQGARARCRSYAPPGYVLDVDRERVDLHRFERLVAQAAEGGDAEKRSSLLREALGLWRGPPLADLAFEPFAHVEIARLEELRTAAREELIQAELELGRHSQLVAELETLVAEHPLRERLRGQLMLALYARAGRRRRSRRTGKLARRSSRSSASSRPPSSSGSSSRSCATTRARPRRRAREPSAAAEERRKTVTMLFADIVDSTSLAAALDPEVLRIVMRRYSTRCARSSSATEGRSRSSSATRRWRSSVSRRCTRTTLCAPCALRTSSREALVWLNADLERDHGLAIQVRTGINTGEVLAGDAASGQPFATGAAVTVAMRLQQAALPGETLLGETTRTVLREAATSEPVEPIEVGGSLGPVRAFRLLARRREHRPTSAQPAPLSSGGEEELAAYRMLSSSFETSGAAASSSILGEAGIGKTRLTSEFVSSLDAEATALVGRCVSYGEGATYLPLAEIVRQAGADAAPGDDHGPARGRRACGADRRADVPAHRPVEGTHDR